MYTVYLRTNTVNGKQYVGQTGNFRKRQNAWNSLTQKYANHFLIEERARYGLDNFTTKVLAEVETQEEAWELEEHYIKELNTLYPNGYNISIEGRTNSGAPKGKLNHRYGKKHTDETIRKMSEVKKGKKRSAETVRKMRESLTGIPNLKLSKQVLQIDIETDEIVAEFPSMAEVYRQLGFFQSTISKCCNNKQKTAYGYKWQYKKVS